MKSNVVARTEESLERIRRHPFILKANSKALSYEQAKRWILCAGRESRSFPLILENLIKDADNPAVRQILQDNLDDEYGHGRPEDVHFHHYLHLLDALGIARAEFDSYNEKAGINFALDLAYNISRSGNRGASLGYMLVNEGMTQITYGAARSALTRYHPNLRIPFFEIHVEVDAHHVEELYKALDSFSADEFEDIAFGIDIGERGMATLLDEALGIFDFNEEKPKFSRVVDLAA